MDVQDKPLANGSDAGNPAMRGKMAARWSLILLALCAVGAVLVVGILALQFAEYSFYKAAPDVWPQPGVGGAVSAPVPLAAPEVAVPLATPTVAPTPSAEVTPAAVSPSTPAAAPAPSTDATPAAAPASTNAPAAAQP